MSAHTGVFISAPMELGRGGSWGSCAGTFSVDFRCGMCRFSRRRFSSSCPCLPLSVALPCRYPATGSPLQQHLEFLAHPCGCCCFPCSRSVTWAACSALCSDILSPQILPAPLTGTADPPLQNISRAQENVFLSRCRISLHLMYPTGA